jgi:hypothetical protein
VGVQQQGNQVDESFDFAHPRMLPRCREPSTLVC